MDSSDIEAADFTILKPSFLKKKDLGLKNRLIELRSDISGFA